MMKNKTHKTLILSLKLTLITGLFFFIINANFSFKAFLYSFGVSAMYSFILGFVQTVINDALSSRYDWITQTNKRVWFGIIVTVGYTIPAILVIDYVLFVVIQKMDFKLFFSKQIIWIHLFWIILSLGISAFLHARSFMLEWKKAAQKESTHQKIIAQKESAKFESLKNQLDPHFLFNSLNVLTSLITEDQIKAEKFTTKLSKVYRYVLEQRNKTIISVKEELQFAQTYMDLLQMRFEDGIQFTIQEKLKTSVLNIVPLSLQLLLENAVKHNVVSSLKPLHIKIYEEEGFLKVKNNKNLKQVFNEKSTKVGLQNISDRYALLSSKKIEINNNNEVFLVSLPLIKKVEIMEIRNEKSLETQAKEHVTELRSFYSHLIIYLLCCGFFAYLNIKYSPDNYWFIYPVLGWGLGLLSHGLTTFNAALPFLGKKWEERKIKEYIKKNS